MPKIAPYVYRLTLDEQRESVAATLAECGHSYADLEYMSKRGWFDNLLSQRVWLAVRDMSNFAPS